MNKRVIISLIIASFIVPYILHANRNTYSVDIQANSYGVHPDDYEALYDDITKKVVFNPIDPAHNDKIAIPMVYVQRLMSDPPGHNFIGTIPNPQINPGFIADSTSSRPYFKLYASKY